MAFSQADIDELKRAIALGAREVRYADGRLVAYRSMKEMVATQQMMEADVAGTGPRPLSADRVATGYDSGLSRGFYGFGSRDGGDW